MCLKRLVGERGFEPPTPWSRTRFQHLSKSVEFCGFQVIAGESVCCPLVDNLLNFVEVGCFDSYKIVYSHGRTESEIPEVPETRTLDSLSTCFLRYPIRVKFEVLEFLR